MSRKIKRAWPAFVFVAILVGIGVLWWMSLASSRGPREFRGMLVYSPGKIGIPEDPPALAQLITATGTYELDVQLVTRGGMDARLHQKLMGLNGKQVVVLGQWGVRRTMLKKHRAIVVEDLRLNTPGTAPTPAPRRPPPAGRSGVRGGVGSERILSLTSGSGLP